MRRLFFGLEVPADIKQRLLRVNAPVPGARWQSPEQLHITLLFLGNVEPERVSQACEVVRTLPAEPFDLNVAGLGCFGQPHNPRHLWAGVQPLESIAALHETLKSSLITLGFSPDNHPFCPHITLARFGKQRGSVRALLDSHHDSVFGHSAVTDFVLFESHRGSKGSVYSVVERFPLQPVSWRGE
ncbi:RNA 2',3'-cyclic phosphodiesterase [Marinobacter sp.]|uniref:RNA 2',3'-cyclic phosphodiesterase n=1 Tax=Marinobacter sp. TaxID=50741 RepID=UPI0034A4A328